MAASRPVGVPDEGLVDLVEQYRLSDYLTKFLALGARIVPDLADLTVADGQQLGMTVLEQRRFQQLILTASRAPRPVATPAVLVPTAVAVAAPVVVAAPAPVASGVEAGAPLTSPRQKPSLAVQVTNGNDVGAAPAPGTGLVLAQASPVFASLGPPEWVLYRDSSGKPYYAHIATGRTQWEVPKGVVITAEEFATLSPGGSTTVEETTIQRRASVVSATSTSSDHSLPERRVARERGELQRWRSAWAQVFQDDGSGSGRRKRSSTAGDAAQAQVPTASSPASGGSPTASTSVPAPPAGGAPVGLNLESPRTPKGAVKSIQLHGGWSHQLRGNLYELAPDPSVESSKYKELLRTESSSSVYDRLTDVRSFTGTHRHRFDETGHGRGLEGRRDGSERKLV